MAAGTWTRAPCPASFPTQPNSLPLLTGRVAFYCFGRFCDPGTLEDVEKENGPSEDFVLSNLEYLVLGRFERKEGDTLGTVKMLWLNTAELIIDSALTEEDADAAQVKWEAEEARIRAEAVQRARTARTGA